MIELYYAVICVLLGALFWHGVKDGEPSSSLYLFLLFLHLSSYTNNENNLNTFGSDFLETALYRIIYQILIFATSVSVLKVIWPTSSYEAKSFLPMSKGELAFFVSIYITGLILQGEVLIGDGKSDYINSTDFNILASITGIFAYILCGELGCKIGYKKIYATIAGLLIALISTNILEGRSLIYTYFGSYFVWKLYVWGDEKTKKPLSFVLSTVILGWFVSNFLRLIRYIPLDRLFDDNLTEIVNNIDWKGSESSIYTYYFYALNYVEVGIVKPVGASLARSFFVLFPGSLFSSKPEDITYSFAKLLCEDSIDCSRSVPAMLYGEAVLNFGYMYMIYPVVLAVIIHAMGKAIKFLGYRFMFGGYALSLMYIARGWLDGAAVIFTVMMFTGVLLKLKRYYESIHRA